MTARTHPRTGSALVAALTATLLVATLLVMVAPLAVASDTTTTFEVTSGGLAVTAPTSADLGTAPTTGTISGSLGSVTATDSRGLTLAGSWTASVVSTNFTTGGATAGETVAKADVTYDSGVGTPSGVVVCTGTLLPTALSATVTAMAGTGATLTNSCTWNPTISLTPSGKAAGTYTGTITHSVA